MLKSRNAQNLGLLILLLPYSFSALSPKKIQVASMVNLFTIESENEKKTYFITFAGRWRLQTRKKW